MARRLGLGGCGDRGPPQERHRVGPHLCGPAGAQDPGCRRGVAAACARGLRALHALLRAQPRGPPKAGRQPHGNDRAAHAPGRPPCSLGAGGPPGGAARAAHQGDRAAGGVARPRLQDPACVLCGPARRPHDAARRLGALEASQLPVPGLCGREAEHLHSGRVSLRASSRCWSCTALAFPLLQRTPCDARLHGLGILPTLRVS
mmetsp:Transcript_89020/g.288308  ORF Transcript_89020/g.288308 Transcript_89020/m.288308 type:complete len:203 (+) Transcript_89020:151-759(+)